MRFRNTRPGSITILAVKTLDNIYIFLLAGLLFGVPVAATYRAPNHEFSVVQGLKQAGVVVAIFLVLLVLNILLARIIKRRKP
jgi:hypothetical protein